MRLGVAPNGRLISYARNQKAASTVLWDHFPQLFVPRQQSRASLWSSIRQWIMNPRGRASISQARRGDCIVENTSDINGVVIANVEEPNRSLCQRCEQQRESGSGSCSKETNSYRFTFVREPLAIAIAGYMEVRMRSRNEPYHALNTLASVLGRRQAREVSNVSSCLSQEQATQEFVRFLTALKSAGQGGPPLQLGSQIFHVFPQTLKILPNAPWMRFDAIGKVEDIRAGVDRTRAAIGTPPMPPEQFRSLLAPQSQRVEPRSWAQKPCARISVTPQVEQLLCDLYEVDYAVSTSLSEPAPLSAAC